jgi:hypothetical protein
MTEVLAPDIYRAHRTILIITWQNVQPLASYNKDLVLGVEGFARLNDHGAFHRHGTELLFFSMIDINIYIKEIIKYFVNSLLQIICHD